MMDDRQGSGETGGTCSEGCRQTLPGCLLQAKESAFWRPLEPFQYHPFSHVVSSHVSPGVSPGRVPRCLLSELDGFLIAGVSLG